jgi:outer membrane autotransporter protein
VGTGVIQTNDATLNFAVGTTAWAADNDGTGGFVNDATSSKITGDAGSTLVMGTAPGNTVNVSLLGSLHDGERATLIDVASGVTTPTVLGTYQDNSYVIDTKLSRVNGDLVMTATRDADTYVDKSGTAGHFSNNAAVRLGTLAADGVSYGQDMQTVLNKLDIDQWGYGNNEANLATQVKRLAPVANNAVGKSALALGAMAADSIGMRMHELRNVPQKSSYESTSVWFMNNYQRGTQTAVGNYDGYTNKLTGMSVGVDTRPNNSSIVGAAFSYGTGTVNQTQFRAGDQANLKSTQLSLYGAYDLTPELFLGGSASVANQNTQGNRATAVGRTALFDFDGTQAGYKVDLGYRFNFKNSTTALTPMLSFEGRTLKQDSYTETNAGDIGLNVASQRLQSKQLGLGLRLTSTQYVGGMVVKPDLTVSTARERGQDASSIASSFIGDNTSDASFNTDLAANSPRTTKVSLGVGVLMSKTSSLMLRYQHVKRDTFTANRAEMTVRWDF